MASTFARYTADGTTAIYAVPCPYIEQAHIKVRQNGAPCTLGVHYDFLNTSQIRFRNGFVPPANALIEVRRETTSNVPLVVYQNGAVLSKDDLNTATLQNLFISQEIKDYYEAALVSGFNRITNGDAVTVQEAIDAAVQGVLESSLLADLQARISDIDGNAESILANTSAINTMQSVIDGYAESTLANTSAINTMQSVIDSLLEFDGVGIATFVLNEQEERIEGDTALANTLALIGAKNGDNTAFILDLDKVRVDGSTSLGTRLSGIDTAVGDNTAAIASETTARVSADSALASNITALASQVSTDVGTLSAAISSEASTRASADSALANTLALIGAKNGDNTAFILDMSTVRVDSTTSLGTRLSGIDTALGNNAAAIATEATARSNADSALSSTLTSLSSTVTNNYNTLNAAISSEATTRADQDSALSTAISNVSAVANTKNRVWRQASAPTPSAVGDLWFDSDDGNKAYRWNGSSWEATDDTRIAANVAAIAAETTARASADSALASDITTLAAQVTSDVGALTAAINSEATARANGDSANASAISTLQSRVTTAEGDISSAALQISAHTSAIAAANGTIASLAAQYMVKTDVNGRVAGFGLHNDGATSEFIVLADKFAIADPSAPAGDPVVPFVVSDGVVHMQDVVIGNALIAELNVGKLVSGTLNADVHMGTGRIICTDGVVMEAMGSGFGSSNQFIRWSGPHFNDLSNCTEANATSYLKRDGSAYFGGSLTAGTLTNQGTTSDSGPTAEIVVGPFGTNGGSKSVTHSISITAYTRNAVYVPSYPNTPPPPAECTVKLYRKVGTGSEVEIASHDLVATLTDNGSVGTAPGGGAYMEWKHTISGSWTTKEGLIYPPLLRQNTATEDLPDEAADTGRV